MMNIAAVLACAGRGVRLGCPQDKAFVDLAGEPVFYHSLRVFLNVSFIGHVAVVVGKDYMSRMEEYKAMKNVSVLEGGARRQDSVYSGVRALPEAADYVIVHDGARPFVDESMLLNMARALEKYEAVTYGIPLKEALKREAGGFVCQTLKREHLYCIQTPQGFKRSLLTDAYKKFGHMDVYDEAQLLELMGVGVKIIEGNAQNIKITYPQDLELARALIEHRRAFSRND